MGKFDGILFVTDLDGTLIQSDGTISKENSDAIRYFQSEGGIFTVATGRYPDFLQQYEDSFKVNGCVIGLNGNIIYDTYNDKTLYIKRIDRNKLNPDLMYIVSTYSDAIRFITINDDVESYNYEGTLYRDVCKCFIVTTGEKEALKIKKDLIEKYGDIYAFERSWYVGLEFYDKNSGKGTCIDYFVKNICPSVKKVICVGDYENDESMLKRADIGYAIKDSTIALMGVADRITGVDNDNHAIAWIINELEKEVL